MRRARSADVSWLLCTSTWLNWWDEILQKKGPGARGSAGGAEGASLVFLLQSCGFSLAEVAKRIYPLLSLRLGGTPGGGCGFQSHTNLLPCKNRAIFCPLYLEFDVIYCLIM